MVISSTQKILWASYLASGRGGVELFKSIDIDNFNSISASELRTFLQSITGDGDGDDNDSDVNEDAFDAIVTSLADDKELKLKEFLSHLVSMTQGERQLLNSIKVSYEAQPSVGMRGSMMRSMMVSMSSSSGGLKLSDLQKLQNIADGEDDDDSDDDDDNFAWNETTMAQNLRKMQYAVRGEVVMKADLLKAEGKEITYTVSKFFVLERVILLQFQIVFHKRK